MVGWTLQVAFPSLKFLIISGLDNVKKIWPNQIPQDSFSKLEVVKVASCGELLNIFPSCVLKRSQSLQLMEVVDCSLLEEVFDVEGVGFPSFVGLLNLLNMVLLFLANTLVSTWLLAYSRLVWSLQGKKKKTTSLLSFPLVHYLGW